MNKARLKKIIKEELLKEMMFSDADARQYLTDRADKYRRQGLEGMEIKMLLQDDFMDDLGHLLDIADYEDLIDQLSQPAQEPSSLPRKPMTPDRRLRRLSALAESSK